MLTRSQHYMTALMDEKSAARSMPGKCVELIDVLTRLQGADMSELAELMPFEMAALNHCLIEARDAAITVDQYRREVNGSVCDV